MTGLAVALSVWLAAWTGLRTPARRSPDRNVPVSLPALLPAGAARPAPPGLRRGRGGRHSRGVVACAAMGVLGVSASYGAPGVLTVVVAGGIGAALVARRRAGRRASGDRERRAAVAALRVLAAEMAAGRVPREALAVAARDAGHPAVRSELTRAVAYGRWGGDEAALLTRAQVGAPWLTQLGACLMVCAQAGAAPAAVIEGLAHRADQGEHHRHEVAAALAGPRAQARILAALPAAGLVLGTVVGGSPLRLLGTPAGTALLVTGLGLEFAGLAWMRRLTERALALLP